MRVIPALLPMLLLAPAAQAGEPKWNRDAAAGYLDARMSWWSTWPAAQRDHGTFCVSCHTVLPYALGRQALGGGSRTAPEEALIASVTHRVQLWGEVKPFYPTKKPEDPKSVESRGTEAVLNAVILAQYGTAEAPAALSAMWAEQIPSGENRGAFPWLQFHNAPWEGDSQYFGALLGAMAAAGEARPNAGLDALRGYLREKREAQTPFHRVMLLWVSAKLPGLLTPAERAAIAEETRRLQQPDGGFSLSTLFPAWQRHDQTPVEKKSDGYATALAALALTAGGGAETREAARRAAAWLEKNQQSDGRWLAYSLNKERDLNSDIGKFMSDAATAYAVLALSR